MINTEYAYYGKKFGQNIVPSEVVHLSVTEGYTGWQTNIYTYIPAYPTSRMGGTFCGL